MELKKTILLILFACIIYVISFCGFCIFFNRFFQQYSWSLVTVRVCDTINNERYIWVYPYNYIYNFNLKTHVLTQPYISGNITCPNREYYNTVISFDYRNLENNSKDWTITCVPNSFSRIYDYFKAVDPEQIYTFNLGRKSGTTYYSSLDIINELILHGIINLEPPS